MRHFFIAKNRSQLWLALTVGTLCVNQAQAYPEYQKFIVKNSGKPVNCALCHVHHDGPEGTAPGQIGHLTNLEQERLGSARAAFVPGIPVDSPILNRFGNHIIHSIGKKKFLELRLAPQELAKVLPQDSDLDGDGIPDVREYLEGTHPLEPNDGNPALLFKTNLTRSISQILLLLAATVAGLYGLIHLLRGVNIAAHLENEDTHQLHRPVKNKSPQQDVWVIPEPASGSGGFARLDEEPIS